MTEIRKVCVVGTGHIGLPLAAVLAEAGFEVIGYDTNEEFITRVSSSGTADFQEEELEALLRAHLGRRLTLTALPPAGQDAYIITVGTPLEPGTDRPNQDRIRVAVERLAPAFGSNPLVVLRSTVSIGTTRNVVLPAIRRHTERFGLAFCPERTIEGKAIPEMRALPQIIGGLDPESADRAESLFRTITPRIVRVSSLEAAEMIKLINNSYRDLTFAFANEVALIAERLGLHAGELIHAANADYARSNVARPGFVGGPCLEKDSLILIDSLHRIDFRPRVIEEARRINQALPEHVATRLLDELWTLGRPAHRAKILISGFAFKGQPATEDVRGSAAIPLMRRLQSAGVEVWGHDFVTPEKLIAELGARACTLEDGLDGADGAVIMNNHPGYAAADIAALVRRMRLPAFLFDSWGLLDVQELRAAAGLRYGRLGSPFQAL
ncbi:MAG TPA: nucleotide sugar dehydrogenase [Methylomirabilota bacterium]|nr:nucleotide sugar dehydrogenase [Methylomirabilota bacterium]